MLDRILITNDDGIEAPALPVVEQIAGKLAHEAKDQDQVIEVARFQGGKTGDKQEDGGGAVMISRIIRAQERMKARI